MENFTLSSVTFGPKVTYEAKDLATATSMAKAWCHYHSFIWEFDFILLEGTVSEPTDCNSYMEMFR